MAFVEGHTVASRYRLIAPLGRGAEGSVWRAEDLAEGGVVAVKRLSAPPPPRWFADVSGLDVPSLVRVRAVGSEGDGGYAVMDLVEGVTLDVCEVGACVTAAADVADALSALHARGLVHGDVKGANVVVRGGRAVLVDLGLVADIGRAAGVDGTVAFLAPEALAGERSAQTDLHALGVTLSLRFGGSHPFVTDVHREGALLEAVSPRRAMRAEVLARIPESLRGCVAWLLAWAPEDRPPSAAAWRARWLRDAGVSGSAGLTSGLARHPRPPRVGGEAAVEAVERAAWGDGLGAVVVGASGAGRTRVLEDALRRLQVDAAQRGEAFEVRAELPANPRQRTVVLLRDAEPEVLRVIGARLQRRRRFAPEALPVTVLASCAEAPGAEGLVEVPLGALDRVRAQRLLDALHGARVPSSALDAWMDVTAGLAGRIVELAARVGDVAVGAATRASLFGELARDAPTPLPEGLDDDCRAALAALALFGGVVDVELAEAVAAASELGQLARAGVILPHRERVLLRGDGRFAALDARDRDAGAARVLSREALRGGDAIAARARALAHRGDRSDAYDEMLRAAARPEVARDTALGWVREAAAWTDALTRHARREAEAMLRAGDAEGAATLLAGDPSAEARGLRMDALRRAGRAEEARALAEELAATSDLGARAVAAVSLCRDALDRGDLTNARAHYARIEGAWAADPAALEVGALLACAEGALDLADDRVERAELAALRGGEVSRRHRLRAVAGIVALRRGDPEVARRAHREAWQLALLAGDLVEQCKTNAYVADGSRSVGASSGSRYDAMETKTFTGCRSRSSCWAGRAAQGPSCRCRWRAWTSAAVTTARARRRGCTARAAAGRPPASCTSCCSPRSCCSPSARAWALSSAPAARWPPAPTRLSRTTRAARQPTRPPAASRAPALPAAATCRAW
jgi:hypothetical protein